jgi:glycosyltransferase involved in cell wall biosynthesis
VQRPFLSIILPAYNEESRLPDTLEKVGSFLMAQIYSSEVWIIDNNSTDQTSQIIDAFINKFQNFYGSFEKEPGKGAAVKHGMLRSQGEFTFMCDADLSMPIEEVNRFLPPQLEGVDVAIASREAPGAIRYHEPQVRHLGGRLMNYLIQLFALPGLNDTQCGFKCFSSQVAKDLFQHQTLNGWSFDIELLFIARKRGYAIAEIPIPWFYHQESKVNAIRDAIKILLDIRTIQKNARLGIYGPEN